MSHIQDLRLSDYAVIHEWLGNVDREREQYVERVNSAQDDVVCDDVPIYMQASRVVVPVRGEEASVSEKRGGERSVGGRSAVSSAPKDDVDYEYPIRQPSIELVRDEVSYGLRDPVVALLFLCALGYMVYLTADGVQRGHVDTLYALASLHIYEYPWLDTLIVGLRQYAGAELFAVLFSVPLSLVALVLAYVSGRAVVYASVVTSVLCAVALSVYFVVEHSAASPIWACVALVAVLMLYVIYVHWERIGFTGTLLEYASGALIHSLPAFTILSLFIMLLYVVFLGWWFLTISSLVTTTLVVRDGVEVIGGAAFAVYFTVFMLFWVSQVTRGIVQMMVASAVSHWFHGERSVRRMFRQAIAAMTRAMTLSLGSLAFGALVVALVELAYFVLRRSKRAFKRARLTPLYYVLRYALRVVNRLIKFINNYAYIEIAMHGHSFLVASHRVYERFNSNPSEMLTSHFTTWYTVSTLRFVVAAASSALGGVMSASSGGTFDRSTLASAFVVAYVVASLLTMWLETATYTVLVCHVDQRERAPKHVREALYQITPD